MQILNRWDIHRSGLAASADAATYNAATFPPHPIDDDGKAFGAAGLETVLVHWKGTGGVLATDTLDIEMLIWDGINETWARFEVIQLKMLQIGEFKVHNSARCFCRITAASSSATDIGIYVSHGKAARARG